MKVNAVKFPSGRGYKIEIEQKVNLIGDENKIFMLIEAQK